MIRIIGAVALRMCGGFVAAAVLVVALTHDIDPD